MRFSRREFLPLMAATVPAISRTAIAQTYPSRPVRIIVGFPAGGSGDVLARLIGQWLSDRLGQQFVVENRPGASANIATEAVTRAPADGYTLLMVGSFNAINATLYEKLNFNFIRDIEPVASIIDTALVLEVHPSIPVKTVPEFITYARATSGKLILASPGIGTPPHVAGELFKTLTGISMIHVPYRGDAPAITDLLGGQAQVMFGILPASIEYIRVGKLRPLAVTTTTRSDLLPDIPTVADFLPGYEASLWSGFGVPKRTPSEIVDKLNKEINAALFDPKIKARFADLGVRVLAGSPAEFAKLIVADTEKWGKVIRAANIKAE
jgi:tripartite-type tricarboxylate transporter receptor subunit TctC